jgi:hypothetical protein
MAVMLPRSMTPEGPRDGLAFITRDQFIHHDHGNATAQRTASPIKTISTSASKSRTEQKREKGR